MPIIIFLADTYKKGKELAARTAEKLSYKYVDREILGEIAKKHDIPEKKLVEALEKTPSLFGISYKTWQQYLAYIQEATLSELLDDKVVCHGLAAHLYVMGVSHVLKVRLLQDHDILIREIASQKMCSIEKAKKILNFQTKLRRNWSMSAYKIDETDLSLYDLVINISQIDDEDAINMIADATTCRKFQPMTYSINSLHDRELEARVKARLMKKFYNVRVYANSGTVTVEIKALEREKEKKAKQIKEMIENMPGVRHIKVNIINDIFRQAIETFR